MNVVGIAFIILALWNIYTTGIVYKHEQAICELLLLHPELLENGKEGRNGQDKD
jgi:hypothetical protein